MARPNLITSELEKDLADLIDFEQGGHTITPFLPQQNLANYHELIMQQAMAGQVDASRHAEAVFY